MLDTIQKKNNAEKDSKKIMEIINRLFYKSDISKLPYYSEFRHVFHLCKFYIIFIV